MIRRRQIDWGLPVSNLLLQHDAASSGTSPVLAKTGNFVVPAKKMFFVLCLILAAIAVLAFLILWVLDSFSLLYPSTSSTSPPSSIGRQMTVPQVVDQRHLPVETGLTFNSGLPSYEEAIKSIPWPTMVIISQILPGLPPWSPRPPPCKSFQLEDKWQFHGSASFGGLWRIKSTINDVAQKAYCLRQLVMMIIDVRIPVNKYYKVNLVKTLTAIFIFLSFCQKNKFFKITALSSFWNNTNEQSNIRKLCVVAFGKYAKVIQR